MTDKELEKFVRSDNPWERARAARNGYGLDILVHDKAPMVDAFMVEKRVLPKLRSLLDAVNAVYENKSEPELVVVEPACLSADEIESNSDEFLASIRSLVS